MYKKITILFIIMAFHLQSAEFLYLSSGESIDIKKVDLQSGKLTQLQVIRLTGLSSFTISPNKKFLYAQSSIIEGKKRKPSIATFAIANDGTLKVLKKSQLSTSVTELKTDKQGNFLAGTRSGNVFIWKLKDGIFSSELAHSIKLEKKTHAVRFSPDNKFLYVPATAPNKVFQLSFDESTGQVTHINTTNGPESGACQPRHLTFHPSLNMIYTSQERLNPGIGVWQWNRKTGNLELAQNIVTDKTTEANITTADIHISPNGKFIYLSSRGKCNEKSEVITFKIDVTSGLISLAGRIQSEKMPRSFCLNKTGDFIYIAGQGEDKLGVYKIDKDTGNLSKVTQYSTGKNPIWVETLKLENE